MPTVTASLSFLAVAIGTKEINVDKARDWGVASATGKQLMDNGMDVPLKNKNESVVLVLDRR